MKSFRVGPETNRLLHRPFDVDDGEVFYALNSNEDVMRYTGEPMLGSLETAIKAISDYPDFDSVGFGRWATVLKSTGKVIGFCGLKFLPELNQVDVGYRYFPEFWGRGIATEACAASLEFGFETIGLSEIIALVIPENRASIRVLEKCSMQPDGQMLDDGILVDRFLRRR